MGCHNWEGSASGIQYVKTGEAAKHLTIHRTAPHNKDYSVPNVGIAKAEKFYPRGINISILAPNCKIESILALTFLMGL